MSLYNAPYAINLEGKIHFISISLLHSLHCNNIEITKCLFSYHYYAHYAVIKTKTLFFLLIIKLISILRLLRQDLEQLHIFISLLLLLLSSRDSDKKIYYFDIHHFYFSTTSTSSTTFTCHDQDNSYFLFLCYVHCVMIKRKIIIWLLRSLRNDLE